MPVPSSFLEDLTLNNTSTPFFLISQSPVPPGEGDFWSKWFLTLLSWRILIEYRGIKGKCATDLDLWKKQMGQADHSISIFLKLSFKNFTCSILEYVVPIDIGVRWLNFRDTGLTATDSIICQPWGTLKK